MRRIAQVISIEGTRRGGAANVMLELLAGGRERGWSQIVLNPFASTPEALASDCEGIPYETLTPHRATALPRARRWLRERLRDFQPDVVQVHLTHAAVTMASLRRSDSFPTVLTHHHHDHLLTQGRPWSARLDRVAGRRFDRVVACSRAVERFLLTEYKYPPSKVVCIPNGWSGSPLPGPSRPAAPTVVCVANFRRQKRHDLLLDAFARVRETMPDARLLLLGDGPLLAEAQQRARRLGLGHSVEFTGSVDVWPRLAESDVFALATRYEGLPVAALEAMAAGLPVVASDVEGMSEVVRPGVTGYLVPPDDREALAERLTMLLSDRELRDRMGRAAREAAQESTMDRCVTRYFELYEELVSERRSGGVQAARIPAW